MFKPELTDFHTSLVLFRGRAVVWYLAAIGMTLLSAVILVFAIRAGGVVLTSWITWGLIVLFGAVAVIRWGKAIELGRVVRELRDHPRIALRQDRLVLRPAARGLQSAELSQEYHLAWDKLKRVESSTRTLMSVLVLSGELASTAGTKGVGSTLDLDVDYSEVELGFSVNDAADTIWHYHDNENERSRLPQWEG